MLKRKISETLKKWKEQPNHSPLVVMAILTFALLGISIVPKLLLEHGDRLAWQLSNWTLFFASLFVAFIGVLLTIHYTKGKHILWKTMAWLGCAILAIICLVSFCIAMVMRDEKIWSSKDYVVYSEYDGPIDPHKFVLYKRDGLIDRRMYSLGNIGFCEVKEANYSMYEDVDLIKEDIDAVEFEGDSVFHRTVFYRLRDGYKFEQEENESLLGVIKH